MRLNRFKREFACNARKLCSEVAQSPLYLRSDEGLIVNARKQNLHYHFSRSSPTDAAPLFL